LIQYVLHHGLDYLQYRLTVTQTFKAEFEALYQPTDRHLYKVQLSELQQICARLEGDAVVKALAARDALVAAQQTGEHKAGAGADARIRSYSNSTLELQIIKKLIVCCGDRAPGSAHKGRKERPILQLDEDSEVGKDKMVGEKKSKKGKGKAQGPGELIAAFMVDVLTYCLLYRTPQHKNRRA
jgi:hypothetical protein